MEHAWLMAMNELDWHIYIYMEDEGLLLIIDIALGKHAPDAGRQLQRKLALFSTSFTRLKEPRID